MDRVIVVSDSPVERATARYPDSAVKRDQRDRCTSRKETVAR